MLLYVECHTYPNTLHLTPKDRPLIVDLLQQGRSWSLSRKNPRYLGFSFVHFKSVFF
jgi:hypothetical protein